MMRICRVKAKKLPEAVLAHLRGHSLRRHRQRVPIWIDVTLRVVEQALYRARNRQPQRIRLSTSKLQLICFRLPALKFELSSSHRLSLHSSSKPEKPGHATRGSPGSVYSGFAEAHQHPVLLEEGFLPPVHRRQLRGEASNDLKSLKTKTRACIRLATHTRLRARFVRVFTQRFLADNGGSDEFTPQRFTEMMQPYKMVVDIA